MKDFRLDYEALLTNEEYRNWYGIRNASKGPGNTLSNCVALFANEHQQTAFPALKYIPFFEKELLVKLS